MAAPLPGKTKEDTGVEAGSFVSRPSDSGASPGPLLGQLASLVLDASAQLDRSHKGEIIDTLTLSASPYLEANYARELGLSEDGLTPAEYGRLVARIVNAAGGAMSVTGVDEGVVRLRNDCCPFAGRPGADAELCRMASSMFGSIAARRFGYAKVAMETALERCRGHCEHWICVDPERGHERRGREYGGCAGHPVAPKPGRSRVAGKALPDAASLVFESPQMKEIVGLLGSVADTMATVLVTGDTGVGKEVVARALHLMSGRADKPFVGLNCGAIPEGLAESVLFGHERGAFTGAVERRPGVFERAEGGTLFLDEIDSLSAAGQARLLRVLQEGEYERVGGRKVLRSDARVVVATNRSLNAAVEQGRFRRDLYYRVNVINLHIPPLCERAQDIPVLARHFLARLRKRYGKPVHSVDAAAMERLLSHTWPGNVRELANVLERSYLFCSGPELDRVLIDGSDSATAAGTCGAGGPRLNAQWKEYREQVLKKAERGFLEAQLVRCSGNVDRVAEAMGVCRRAVYMKLKQHGFDAKAFRCTSQTP